MRSCPTCRNLYEDDALICGRDGDRLGPPDPLLGAAVGRWRLGAPRGRGGMGTVYVGTPHEAGAEVALKVLAARFARRPDLVERFRTEASAAAKIQHPNIVDFIDSGVLPDGRPYYVMELLDGEDLATYLRRIGWISAGEAIQMVAQVLDGISAAHEAGVIHRDLKPENLFVSRRADGTRIMKVLDFGVAKLTDVARAQSDGPARRTLEGVVVGSGPYMAPEQAAGRVHEIGPATDMWSLGVVLYLMLTGEYPFAQTGSLPAFHRAPAPPSAKAPSLPAGIDEILGDMLTINPVNRARHARAVAHALRSLAPALPPVGAADGAHMGMASSNSGGAVMTVPTAATVVPPPQFPVGTPITALPTAPLAAAAAAGVTAAPTATTAPMAAERRPEPTPATLPPSAIVFATEPAMDRGAGDIQINRPAGGYKPSVRPHAELPPDLAAAAPQFPQMPSPPQPGFGLGTPSSTPAAARSTTEPPDKLWVSQIIRIKKVERSTSQMAAVSDFDDPKPSWIPPVLGIIVFAAAVGGLIWFAIH